MLCWMGVKVRDKTSSGGLLNSISSSPPNLAPPLSSSFPQPKAGVELPNLSPLAELTVMYAAYPYTAYLPVLPPASLEFTAPPGYTDCKGLFIIMSQSFSAS